MTFAHRTLHNDDVLHEIFLHLRPQSLDEDLAADEEEARQRARHDLTNIARVSKKFAEHALNALWSELDDLVPVMQLFSESHDLELDDAVASGQADGQGFLNLGHLISDTEWTRFCYYSVRVRIIHSSGFGAFEASLISHLIRRNASKPLFPGLRSLTHVVSSGDTGLPSLIAPSLRTARLTFGEEWNGRVAYEQPVIARKVRDYNVQLGLNTVCSNAPLLRNLRISGVGRVSSLSSLLYCHNLRFLEIRDVVLTARLVHTLASLQDLQELHCKFPFAEGEWSHRSGFIALRVLRLSGPMDRLPDLLDMVASPHLHTLHIFDESNKASHTECCECSAVISKFPSLRTLHFSADYANTAIPLDVAKSRPLTELLGPLLNLHDLHTLSISRWQPGGYTLNDADMQALADAFPHIVSLALTVNRGEAIPTLESLVILARSCPALVTLELPSITIAAREQLRPMPVGPHGLRTLVMGDPDRVMEMYDPVELARWLHGIFPQYRMSGECEEFPPFMSAVLRELRRLQTRGAAAVEENTPSS